MSEPGPVRPPLGALLWRVGGAPRAIVARLEGGRDRLEQLTSAIDDALAASPLLRDPLAALVAPITLDHVLGDRPGAHTSGEGAAGAAGAPSWPAGIGGARPRAGSPDVDPARSTAREREHAAAAPGQSPLRSAMPPATSGTSARASGGERAAGPASVDRIAAQDIARPAIDQIVAPRGHARARDTITAAEARAWLLRRAERAGSAAILDQIVAPAATGVPTATMSPAIAPAAMTSSGNAPGARTATGLPVATTPSTIAPTARAATRAPIATTSQTIPSTATGLPIATTSSTIVPGARTATRAPIPTTSPAIPPTARTASLPIATSPASASTAATTFEPPGEPAHGTIVRLADLVERLAPASPARPDRPGPSRSRSLTARRSTALPEPSDRAPASPTPASPVSPASPASPASPPSGSLSPADRGPASASSPSSPSASPASAPLSPLRRFALNAEAPAPPSPGAPTSHAPTAQVDDAELADRIDRILRREARREGLDLDP